MIELEVSISSSDGARRTVYFVQVPPEESADEERAHSVLGAAVVMGASLLDAKYRIETDTL